MNVNTLEHQPAHQLELNEIGLCHVTLDRPVAFDPYTANRETGGFILIDKLSNDTVGAGLLNVALRRADNIHWQALDVTRSGARAAQGTTRLCAVVHGPVRRRQVDHRQSGREATACTGPSHLRAGRGQHPPWPEPGPGFHRRGPGGEHPPRGRSGQTDGRCGPDRAGVVHLAVPLRARDGPRPARRGGILRDLRGHAAGRGREARPQGAVQEGKAWRVAAFHRHRFTLRAAGAARRSTSTPRRLPPPRPPSASSPNWTRPE